MTDRKEKHFLDEARRILKVAEQELDAATLSRLRAARARTLDPITPRDDARAWRPAWLLPVGGFAAAGVVLAVAGMLWFTTPSGNGVSLSGIENLDLLTAVDNPEFYADLDFYRWLASQNHAG